MEIIVYNSYKDIVVQFKDKYKARVKTQYHHFAEGTVQNPYHPTVYGVGILGDKYQTTLSNGRRTKEYEAWRHILLRSFDNRYKNKKPTYKGVVCCKEWLLFENFYKWIHSQGNFEKWLNNPNWHVDKDILIKGNKIYSPATCTLVPQQINSLFAKDNARRGNLPIGVQRTPRCKNKYLAECHDFYNDKTKYLGIFDTIEEAFNAYKIYKEDIIKQVAQIEYDNGNITRECYDAMMNYIVEITD